MNAFFDSALVALSQLHLIRPHWLWAALLVVPGSWWWLRRQRRLNVWRDTVDPQLLPYLLVGGNRRSHLGLIMALVGYLAVVFALAGPSWRKGEEPLFHSRVPLVIALDMSSSIEASDLPPSRLLQARAKLASLLKKRAGGEVALLAYSGEAFTVAPLTDDANNVALFLDSLSPSVMPVDGKRGELAIESAVQLLQHAGFERGDILLVTDSADARTRTAAGRARAAGYDVSALGLGTPRGAAYRAADGSIQQAKLDESSLQALARTGGGRYRRLSIDDSDLKGLGVLDPGQQDAQSSDEKGGQTWVDDGYWLIPLVMLLMLFGFRRRGALAAIALVCLLPLARPAVAAEQSTLWQRSDQVAHKHLENGVKAYRDGDYAAAQKQFEGVDTDQGWYNLGNALAKQGNYDAAIDAYDEALKQNPKLDDAIANRAAVEAAHKRQQKQQGNKQGGKGQNGNNKQNQDQSQSDGQQGASKQSPKSGDGAKQDGKDSKASDKSPQQDPSKEQDRQSAGQPPKDDATDPPKGEDAQAQQQADEAQRQRMQQAMQGKDGKDQQRDKTSAAQSQETQKQREQREAVDAWMRRVPDDPGSLLRAKFRLEYERRHRDEP